MILIVRLPSPAPAGGTTVTLATEGRASSDDYTLSSTSITIGKGGTWGEIAITVTADSEDEGDESVNIFACIKPGCVPDPLDPEVYSLGLVIPGTRVGGV